MSTSGRRRGSASRPPLVVVLTLGVLVTAVAIVSVTAGAPAVATGETTAASAPELVSPGASVESTEMDEDGENAENTEDAGTLTTTYTTIEYHEGYREDAEAVAEVVDDHYRVLHQKFGTPPADEPVEVVVGPQSTFPCDSVGCVGPFGTVYLASDSRSLLHHELVHVLQIRHHWSVTQLVTSPETAEGALIEGTAAYLDAPPSSIATTARFDPDRIELTAHPETSTEYADRALFVEYVLHEYGREAFDVLYLDGDVEALEAETGTAYEDLERDFSAQLDEQRERLRDGGAPLPAFTHEPFAAQPGTEIVLDAGTPDAVAAIDRSWYPDAPDAFEWDLTGDGEIDAAGETVTHAVPEDAADDDHEVTLYVTIDGEEYVATQPVLVERPFDLVDVDLPTTATAGESGTATATVEHVGTEATTETIAYVVGNESVGATDVELDPGERETVTIQYDLPADLEGESIDHVVTVGDVAYEDGTVLEITATTEASAEDASDATPLALGSGLGAALVVLLVLTGVLARHAS